MFAQKAFNHKSLSLKFIEACKSLDLSSSSTTLKYFTTQADNLKKDDIPTSYSAGYICLNLENLKVPQAALESFCSNLKFPII